jgi:hypothetical protein
MRKRIDWRDIRTAWNEAYPNDPMTPEILKRTFYRAVADGAVQQGYFERTGAEIMGILAWSRLLHFIESLAEPVPLSLAADWAIILSLNDIPLDRHFPTPEVERMIKDNPYYARDVLFESLAANIMQDDFRRHRKASQGGYEETGEGEKAVLLATLRKLNFLRNFLIFYDLNAGSHNKEAQNERKHKAKKQK